MKHCHLFFIVVLTLIVKGSWMLVKCRGADKVQSWSYAVVYWSCTVPILQWHNGLSPILSLFPFCHMNMLESNYDITNQNLFSDSLYLPIKMDPKIVSKCSKNLRSLPVLSFSSWGRIVGKLRYWIVVQQCSCYNKLVL